MARYTSATIVAVDNHQPYLDELQRRAEAAGLAGRIAPCLRNMADLHMEEELYDLVWSEGALYSMGFGKGLETCYRLLRPRGLLGVSELTWLRPDPPAECREYFAEAYPVMVDVEANLATAGRCGFEIVGHFTLPDSAWMESFYDPLEERLLSLHKKNSTDLERSGMIESFAREIEMYRRYSRYYGYEFYLMQRP